MLRVLVLTVIALPAIIMALLDPHLADTGPPWRPSEYMIKVYKELGQKSPFTPNKTNDHEELSRTIVELLDWTPPDYISKNFPYYFAGYSYDGKPGVAHNPILSVIGKGIKLKGSDSVVWIVEAGRFDINDLIRKGPKMVEAIEIALEQAFLHIFRSMDAIRVGDRDIPRAQVILDLDGMSAKKVSHPQAFALGFKMAYRYLDVGFYGLETAILINSNYFVETLINIARPVLGQLMERVEIYGSNKNKWLPRLQRLLPSSSLPPWYGGSQDFRPIAAYG